MRSWIFIVVLQVVACASQPQPQVARYLSGERRLGPPVSDSSYEAYIRGELWFANEQYEASIRAFQRAIDHGPRDPHVMARLAEAMYRSGHSSEAREYLQESLREYPYSESLWLAQSRIMQKENNVYGAISALLRAEHAASLTRDRSLTLVNVLHANGYDHRAVALRRSYLQKKQSVSFGALRGDLLAAVQAQETTWAVQAATRLLNAYPSSADEVRAAARMAYERRVFLAAARLLDQVSRDVPDEVLRVESLIHAGQPRRALAILETSSPDRFGGELVMAKLYLDLGKTKRAQELCDVALAADRNLSEAHFIRGVALYKDERHAESAKEFALVARGSSKYVRAQYELARVLTRMGLHAQALEILEHAISQMPEKSHELREALANMFLEQDYVDEALRLFEQPQDVYDQLFRGVLLERSGDTSSAVRVYLSVSDSQLSGVPEELVARVKAERHWSEGESHNAQRILRRHIEQHPHSEELRVRLLEMLSDEEEPAEMLKLIEQAKLFVHNKALRERVEVVSKKMGLPTDS